jgi:acylaminoacyl-peptidase
LALALLRKENGMASKKRRSVRAEDLYSFRLISRPQISPCGNYVAFSLHRVDKKTQKKSANLWLASLENSAVRQFTYGDQLDLNPKWSALAVSLFS